MMPRNLRLAVLFSFILHGMLILAARYRASYDAYNHMFFGDHYRMDWWTLWEPRWYTGFSVQSYPPLVHQLIGLTGHIVGLDAAFALLLWITVTILPLAVFSFSRIFVGKAAAGYASLGAAFVPSAYLTAHIFGQLPTLMATTTALFGTAALHQYLRDGKRIDLVLAIFLMATVMAFHHATLLFLPWLIAGLTIHLLITKQIKPQPLFARLSAFGIPTAAAMFVVIWPFWLWGQTQSIQTPIDHLSRHNFFTDLLAPVLFFLPMYGPLMLIIPFAFLLASRRQLAGPGMAFGILFLLGLGGTTPLPRLFFSEGWEWLTYDRFAFWASLVLLPFFGIIVILLRQNYSKRIVSGGFLALIATSMIVGSLTAFLPLQPGAVDLTQVVDFLEQDDHSDWRYLTFGFGDQLALLSTLTTATTLDGSYHTARSLPELRSSGIAQIDTAFWFPKGLAALEPILRKADERGVRWGFVNTPQYIPVLEQNGWIKLMVLKGGVQVWENPDAILAEPSQPPPASPFASFAWGTFPLLSMITTLSLASLRLYPVQAEKVLRGVHAFVVGLIPLALSFWYYRTLAEFSHDRVYFTYDHALFFLSDSLILLSVILWLSIRLAQPTRLPITNHFSSFPLIPLLLLLALSTLSTFWSTDWRTSIYISLHLWLIFLLILSLRHWIGVWKPVTFGLCAALSIQIIAGFTGFALQSTSFLEPWNMKWPGLLEPSMRGASVVQLHNGLRFLRAYGTFPHPNILAGFSLVSLLGPTHILLTNKKLNHSALVLFVFGIILTVLTFSRSGWLGYIVYMVILILKSKYLDQKRLWLMVAASVLTIVLALYPLRALVFTRISNAPVQTEQLSTFGRSWLTAQAVEMIRENPLGGVGAGSFVLRLADYAVEGALIEPVHNLFLLVGAELGIVGFILLASLYASTGLTIIRVQTPNAILASGTIAGLGVISLFDHYLWTVAPGRLLLGLAFGLWVGQVAHSDA